MLFIADVKLYQLQAFYYRHIAFNVARLLLNENGNMPIYIKKQHTLTHSEGYLPGICLPLAAARISRSRPPTRFCSAP
jgi:hypothetical protein